MTQAGFEYGSKLNSSHNCKDPTKTVLIILRGVTSVTNHGERDGRMDSASQLQFNPCARITEGINIKTVQ